MTLLRLIQSLFNLVQPILKMLAWVNSCWKNVEHELTHAKLMEWVITHAKLTEWVILKGGRAII